MLYLRNKYYINYQVKILFVLRYVYKKLQIENAITKIIIKYKELPNNQQK